MDLEGIMLSAVSQTEKEKNSLSCHLFMESEMNAYKQTEADSQIQGTNQWPLVGRGKRGGARGGRESRDTDD